MAAVRSTSTAASDSALTSSRLSHSERAQSSSADRPSTASPTMYDLTFLNHRPSPCSNDLAFIYVCHTFAFLQSLQSYAPIVLFIVNLLSDVI